MWRSRVYSVKCVLLPGERLQLGGQGGERRSSRRVVSVAPVRRVVPRAPRRREANAELWNGNRNQVLSAAFLMLAPCVFPAARVSSSATRVSRAAGASCSRSRRWRRPSRCG
eukprot:6197996-Pleurochrysis_carterae.AAC.2